MARIRGDGLRPEAALSAELSRMRLRHARNAPELPGRPDMLLSRQKLAVFVHGCFWHGCAAHYREPKSNRAFWTRKVEGNRRRDRRVRRALRALGYRTMVVWEHELKADAKKAARRVAKSAAAIKK